MKRYYYRAWYDDCIINKKKNTNRYVAVYSINKEGYFNYHGEIWEHSASYRGVKAMAAEILENNLNYKLDSGRYTVIEPKIELLELP